MSGVGTFGVTVWPVYIGAAMEGATPPHSINEPRNGGYQRGQIHWHPVDDARQVIGRARLILPPGVFTHFVFFKHPTLPQACGVQKMPHPLQLTELVNVIDVDPIINGDLALSRMQDIHP